MIKILGTPKQPTLQISYDYTDIQAVADPIQLSESDIWNIMLSLHKSYDASIGINWNVINASIDYYIETHKKANKLVNS